MLRPPNPNPPAVRGARLWPACALLLATAAANAADREKDRAALYGDIERLTVVLARKAITIHGDDVEDAVIVIRDGKIDNVGRALEYPRNARVIDARDRVVMPGLINAFTRFGLPAYERRGVHANLNVADEWVAEAADLEPLLELGFTTVALIPPGEDISGRAMVVHTGGAADQRVVREKSYLCVESEKKELRAALQRAKDERDKVRKAREEFENQQKNPAQSKPAAAGPPVASQPDSQPSSAPASQPASQPVFQPPPIDPAYQPLVDWIEKSEDLFAVVRLLRATSYVHLNEVAAEFEVTPVWCLQNFNSTDFYRVVADLGKSKASVIVRPYRNLVQDTADRFYLAADLARAGCTVALVPTADTLRSHELYLSNVAELVAAGGWERKEALRAITLHPAKLLRLDDRLGTIEKGRIADLAFFDADPLRPGARVREVMIAGEMAFPAEKP